MRKTLLIIAGLIVINVAQAQFTFVSDTFNFTGGMQTFTVPTFVDTITLKLWGAQGGNAVIGGTGGLGGYVEGKRVVMAGQVYNLFVGGQNGYNGGGQGGINGNDQFSMPPQGDSGAVGGGGTDVCFGGTTFADRIAVAGGGGGAGHNGVWPACQVSGPAGNGGSGGGLVGGSGTFGVGTPCNCGGGGGDGGLGGTQSAGGAAGMYYGSTACLRSSWMVGANGTLGVGGSGSNAYHNGTGGGGGGGGGYYGGGSGGNGSDTTPGGGGGGGSSYTGTLIAPIETPGTKSGNGRIVIEYWIDVTSVDAHSKLKGLKVYPNPFGDHISINLAGGNGQTVTIYNILGASVGSWTFDAGQTLMNINTSEFAKGVYIVEVKYGNEVVSTKLVK